MEREPGTAKSDTSCRKLPEAPEMPGEGPRAEGHEVGGIWENAYFLLSEKMGER